MSAGADTSLTAAHDRKRRLYSTKEVTDWATQRSDAQVVLVSSLTFNWRGVMAAPSFELAKLLGVSHADLRLMAVRVVEATARMWKRFQLTTGI
jgi:hypothetical protein